MGAESEVVFVELNARLKARLVFGAESEVGFWELKARLFLGTESEVVFGS